MKYIILLPLLALIGCESAIREQNAKADDAVCAGRGFAIGTEQYTECRSELDRLRRSMAFDAYQRQQMMQAQGMYNPGYNPIYNPMTQAGLRMMNGQPLNEAMMEAHGVPVYRAPQPLTPKTSFHCSSMDLGKGMVSTHCH